MTPEVVAHWPLTLLGGVLGIRCLTTHQFHGLHSTSIKHQSPIDSPTKMNQNLPILSTSVPITSPGVTKLFL